MRPIIFAFILVALTACSVAAIAADPVADGGRIFTLQCGGCHTVSTAGPASLGPRLDDMLARAKAQPDPAAWLRAAITAPATEVAPGYQAGLMPAIYGQSLRPDELDALLAYMLASDEP
jgi:mono/diheme cytochrome c family protein